MKFRTELDAKQNQTQITYKDSLLFLGSCFADNMSGYFQEKRFKCTSNPFGTLYHPVAISNAIQMALNDDYEINILKTKDLWASYDLHSSLNRPTKQEFIQNFRVEQKALKQNLLNSQFLFITLGTAHVYRHIQSNTIVANCHKIPQTEFTKVLLSLDHIKTTLEHTIDRLLKVNPAVKIVLTLSPVRYLRDGFEENQLSKSLLYVAIKHCVSKFNHVVYFPSYEYILDDLRDYRFYEKDLVHPNQIALDYIWEKLKSTFFTHETLQILKRVEKINSRLAHRLFSPDTPKAKAFLNETHQLIHRLQEDFPGIDFGF